MQNAEVKVLSDLDQENTLAFNKEDTFVAPPVPPLARRTKKGSSSAGSLDHYEICISSPSKRGQVLSDERKGARPGKSFDLGYGDHSPSKYSGNADPELPGQPVLKSTANTSLYSYPLVQGRLSETGKWRHRKKGVQSTHRKYADMISDITPLGLRVPLWFRIRENVPLIKRYTSVAIVPDNSRAHFIFVAMNEFILPSDHSSVMYAANTSLIHGV